MLLNFKVNLLIINTKMIRTPVRIADKINKIFMVNVSGELKMNSP